MKYLLNEGQIKIIAQLKELLSEAVDHVQCKGLVEYDECVCDHCVWRSNIREALRKLTNLGL